MESKNANFINSVAQGEIVPCPVCNANNEPGSKFCMICGSAMQKEASAPAFAPVEEAAPAFAPVEEPAPAFAPTQEEAAAPTREEVREEPVSAFAQGLPAWDIVPPQIMVKRRGGE